MEHAINANLWKVDERYEMKSLKTSSNYIWKVREKSCVDLLSMGIKPLKVLESSWKSTNYNDAKIWNSLPDQIFAANKIGTFKNLISKLDFKI